jgi:hypothetical protein
MSQPSVSRDQCRAHSALQVLLSLGLSQKDVASRTGLNTSAISHINGIFHHPYFHVSSRVAASLERLVTLVRIERAFAVLSEWPLVVTETCNDEGAVVDEALRAEIGTAIVQGLCRAARDADSVRFELPATIEGALAKIGDDAWIMVRRPKKPTDPPDGGASAQRQLKVIADEIARLQIAIHELKHLQESIEEELPPSDGLHVPRAAY